MTRPKGLLLVTMQPAAEDEQEFHDWYDTEHLPERLAVDGFLSGQRYVCHSGWPRYMAAYDLAYPDVLREDQYRAISGDRFSPWSKRILARMHGLYRVEGVQITPGDSVTGAKGAGMWLTLLRFRDAGSDLEEQILQGLKQNYGSRPDVLQFRLFHSVYDCTSDYIALVELGVPGETLRLDSGSFGSAANNLDMVNHYSRYWRSGRLHGIVAEMK